MSKRAPLPAFLEQRILPSHSPGEVRLALLRDLLSACGGDMGLAYMVVQHGGEQWFRSAGIVHLDAPEPFARLMAALEGQPTPPSSIDSITAAHHFEIQTARDLDPEFVRMAWEPSGIHSSIGTNVLDDSGRHVAWIGAFRRGGSARFEAGDLRCLKGRLEPYRDMLLAIQGSTASDPGDAVLVLSETGATLMASDVGLEWLEVPGFRDALLSDVQALHEDRQAQRRTHFRSATIALTRVEGVVGKGYVVTISRHAGIEYPTILRLTRAQRQVAKLVAQGASTKEVAEHLGRSQETVRSHLKAAYDQLGISTRAELAMAVVDAGAPHSGLELAEE